MIKSQILLVALLLAAASAGTVAAFAPHLVPTARVVPATPPSSSSVVVLSAAARGVPNLFKKLPWEAEKERRREARRMKLERARLHRELGIVEDATYEDIVKATDNLIAAAGKDIKQKIKIEVAKDKILQIRLNERLAGLTTETKEARAQSSFEREGGDDDVDSPNKKQAKEWNAPLWTQGLIKKPDEEYRNRQIKLWGFITLLGAGFPPAQEYMNRFTWLVCVAQLRFRGMPKDQADGGGFGVSFGGGRGGKHGKVAWLLGVTIWLVGATLVYGLMPAWAKGHRWTPTLGFTLQNLIYAVACSYLQPYKG